MEKTCACGKVFNPEEQGDSEDAMCMECIDLDNDDNMTKCVFCPGTAIKLSEQEEDRKFRCESCGEIFWPGEQ